MLSEDPHSVIIESIAPTGLIAEWNHSCDAGLRDADFAVNAGDRITCINGKLGDVRVIRLFRVAHKLFKASHTFSNSADSL